MKRIIWFLIAAIVIGASFYSGGTIIGILVSIIFGIVWILVTVLGGLAKGADTIMKAFWR